MTYKVSQVYLQTDWNLLLKEKPNEKIGRKLNRCYREKGHNMSLSNDQSAF